MKEKIILKSVNPEKYEDLEVECKSIANEKIGEYLENIPEERKFTAFKTASISARTGIVGERIKTTLLVNRNGKIYVLSEVENEVELRMCKDGIQRPDVVVTNINSMSNEEYIVKYDKFIETYMAQGDEFFPKPEVREFTQIDEDVTIMTSWGEPAYCLKGSYIVTYNALENDYNTVEQGAFDSTYTKKSITLKKLAENFHFSRNV